MSQDASNGPLFPTLVKALQVESDQLKNARKEITLFGGAYLGSFADQYYYRFEVPEDLYLKGVERVSFIISQLQSMSLDGSVIALENQFLTVALPIDFGTILPEIKCTWNYEEHLKPVISLLSSGSESHPLVQCLFQPDRSDNVHQPGFEPTVLATTPQDQQDALKRILQNRVSYVWGPILCGKTHLLALVAANYAKAGKKVLFVANTNDRVDETVLRIIQTSKELGVDGQGAMTRVGLPVRLESELLGPLSLEYDVGTQKSEKKKALQERTSLLQTYWKTKIHQFLHDDFYSRVNDLRGRINENKRQLEKIAEELAALKETILRAQTASMLEKLKKGYKEDLAAAQKQQSDKQAIQKKLQSIHHALNTELARLEAQAPIGSNELKEYQAAVKRTGELGGVKVVTDSVEQLASIDEEALLKSKRLVATTVGTALTDTRLRNLQFDLVIVDDAETISTPFLAALALLAREKMLVAGDPFQVGPESYSNTDLAQTWLQRDIFLHVAHTEQLHNLFNWSKQHAQWSIVLSSHFATTPKLSLFVASILFDDKINVFALPNAKGKIYFIDTKDLKSSCRQYASKKKIVPYNDLQTKRTIELVKHALLAHQRTAADVGVILPFPGSTMYTKQQIRLHGIRNVEVGTPSSFRCRRKKAIIFDAMMAGVDYTMRQIDDKKISEHRIARLFNSIFSCVEEDLYVLADMSHFTAVYKDRLWTKLLMLLQTQSDTLPPFTQIARQFDDLDWDKRSEILSTVSPSTKTQRPVPSVEEKSAPQTMTQKVDAELELRMKMISKQQGPKPAGIGRNFERETYAAVHRVLGWKKDVNLLSQYMGGDLLFRHSLSTEQAAARLPIDSCQNEEEFRKIMERWNLLMYEMSGGSKTDLSFFAKTAPETRVRWDINSLKAFYSSDVEAALEEGKHKIATSVTKVFQECLGKSQPANPVDWSTAYLNFLGKIDAYLGWISEQLRK